MRPVKIYSSGAINRAPTDELRIGFFQRSQNKLPRSKLRGIETKFSSGTAASRGELTQSGIKIGIATMPLYAILPSMLNILGSIFFCLVFLPTAIAWGSPSYISLSPEITEILFALGLEGSIVGDTYSCNYPPKAKSLTKVGTFSDPNIEKIISLKPDIVFATGIEQAPAVDRLKKSGLNVFVSNPKTISGLFESIRKIGLSTGKNAQAESLIKTIQEKISAIESQTKAIPPEKKPKVFIEIWHDPIMTAGRQSIIDELLEAAGGINIAYDAPRAYSRFSSEVIIKRDPDCVILGYMSSQNLKNSVLNRLGWEGIKAIKNNRVISDINPDILLRAGPRVAQGIEEIYKRLYPKK